MPIHPGMLWDGHSQVLLSTHKGREHLSLYNPGAGSPLVPTGLNTRCCGSCSESPHIGSHWLTEVILDWEVFSKIGDPVNHWGLVKWELTPGFLLNRSNVVEAVGEGRVLKGGSPSAANVSLRSALSMKPSRF